jgi:isoamylase
MDSQGKESWAAELRVGIGKPFPLGVSKYAQGANFAVYTEETDEVALILYPPHQDKEGSRDLRRAELALDPKMNRTGQVWHSM